MLSLLQASQGQTKKMHDSFLAVLRVEDVDGWKTSCSRVYTGSEAVMQPVFFIPGGEQRVCLACSKSCFAEGLVASDTSGQLRVRCRSGRKGSFPTYLIILLPLLFMLLL